MKEIVQDGTPILREIAKPVPEELFGSAELSRLISDMAEALDYYPEGVAIAAPQVGVQYRLFIVRKDRTLHPPSNGQRGGSTAKSNLAVEPPRAEVEVYINPEIVKTSRKKAKADEGCLSVHGMYGTTNRHEQVTIKARGIDGSHIMRGAGGLMAQIFEHEIDHLNGILFTDRAEHLINIFHYNHPFAFFGTPQSASDTLAILIERELVPSIVVTAPDAPKGRGLALAPSETKVCALAHGISVITPEKLDAKTVAIISALGCDYAIVVAYGKLFPEALIDSFPKGVLNVHYSILPKCRGATPLESALLAGDAETGVTIQKMIKTLDAGDIIAQETTTIAPDETARELRPRLIEIGASLLVDTLPAYLAGNIVPIPQDASLSSYTQKLTKEDGLLSLDAPAEVNWKKYRAYADTIGTYFYKNGKRMKITSAEFVRKPVDEFRVLRVIPEGKREMAY